DPPAQHPIELGIRGCNTWCVRRGDFAHANGAGITVRRTRSLRGGRDPPLFHKRVPAAAIRAAAQPLGGRVSARLAFELRLLPGHEPAPWQRPESRRQKAVSTCLPPSAFRLPPSAFRFPPSARCCIAATFKLLRFPVRDRLG